MSNFAWQTTLEARPRLLDVAIAATAPAAPSAARETALIPRASPAAGQTRRQHRELHEATA